MLIHHYFAEKEPFLCNDFATTEDNVSYKGNEQNYFNLLGSKHIPSFSYNIVKRLQQELAIANLRSRLFILIKSSWGRFYALSSETNRSGKLICIANLPLVKVSVSVAFGAWKVRRDHWAVHMDV